MSKINVLIGKSVDKIDETSENPDIKKISAFLKSRSLHPFARSICVRMVDAGSSNDVEFEEGLTGSPQVDAERFGIRFVASPRHADILVVSGPVTINAKTSLIKTYEAMPDPKAVVALGDGACLGWIHGPNYAIYKSGKVSDVVPVAIEVQGNPPNPYAIIYGILKAGDVLRKHAAVK